MATLGAALLFAGLASALGAEHASAQATGLPTFFAPTRAFGSSELGVSLSRPGGGATGLEGRFSAALNRADFSLRAGYADGGGSNGGSAVAGAEVRLPVLGRSPTFPLDGALIFGVGRSFDPGQTIVPIGLSLGRRLELDRGALHLTPYVQPTVIFAGSSDFVFGLGVDVGVRGLPDVRVNWAAGDMDGFSVSLFWPG